MEERSEKELGGHTDASLADLVKTGDADAFSELASRYLGLVRSKVVSFRCSALDSDDLCQEGLLGLYSAACNFQAAGAASFQTYAGICIENRIIMAYRKAMSRKNAPLNSSVPLSEEPELPSPDSENPEALLMAREGLLAAEHTMMKTLSKMEQKVFRLYLSGSSYSEIAECLEISAKAADNALQRVRAKLKKHFK